MCKPEQPPADKLTLTLPLGISETPTSYASRLAALNGSGGVVRFCTDMGFRWRDLATGDAETIKRLATISGANCAKLARHATQLFAKRQYRMAGVDLKQRDIELTALRLCPDCLVRDREVEGEYGPFERSHWRLRFLEVCSIHQTPLMSVRLMGPGTRVRDTAEWIKSEWPEIEAAAGHKYRRPRSTAEKYYVARYHGRKKGHALDSVDLITAARASQAVGAALASNGKTVVPTGDARRKATIINTGFEALQGGLKTMRPALIALAIRKNRPAGLTMGSMGALAPWLLKVEKDPDFAEIAAMIRESAVAATAPIERGKGDQRTNVEEVRLGRTEAAKRLGIDRELLLKLQDHPWWPVQPYAPNVWAGYSEAEINAFLKRIKRRASHISKLRERRRIGTLRSEPDLDQLDLLRWVVERKVRYRMNPKFNGLRGVTIEMRSLEKAANQENALVPRALAAKILSVSEVTIDWLIQCGHLKSHGLTKLSIQAQSLRQFHARYVSAHEIAHLLGITTSAVFKEQWRHRVWAELAEIGHTPIFARRTVWLAKSLGLEKPNAGSCGEECEVCGEKETLPS